MAYDAKAVANFFLDLAKEEKKNISPMKLQKLLFFAHGWNLALFDEPLIADAIEAWQFGPVVPSIYHEFKHLRSGAISSRAMSLDLENFKMFEPCLPSEATQTKALLKRIWEAYGGMSAIDLSNLTHADGSPWALAVAKFGANTRRVPINDESIRTYFKQQAERNRAEQAVDA